MGRYMGGVAYTYMCVVSMLGIVIVVWGVYSVFGYSDPSGEAVGLSRAASCLDPVLVCRPRGLGDAKIAAPGSQALALRVQVPNYKASTQHHNFDSEYGNLKYPPCWYFGQ